MANINLYKQLEKVVVNSGIGRLAARPGFNDKILPQIEKEMAAITGQKPSPRAAKKSIAGFKTREGNVIGLKITLRGKRMAQFLEKVGKATLPRVRDFRGIPLKNVDEGGNLTFGIKEHIVFPEINPEETNVSFGVQVTVVPKEAESRDAAINLYRELGIPLEK